MATLYITEFERQGIDTNGNQAPAAIAPSLADQTVTIGATSAQSSAFNAGTSVVRLESDVTCSVKFGTNPTATTSTMRLYANSPEYFIVPPGQSLKVAAISNS